MVVNIVIATRNRRPALQATLDAVSRVCVPDGVQAELVVVDNGSTDDTGRYLSSYTHPAARVRVLHEPAGGKSVALNTALRCTSGDVLMFLDDDVEPRRDWLIRLASPFADRRFDIVAGTVRIPPVLLRPWMTPAHRAWLASTESFDPSAPAAVVGANMAFSRHVLAGVPGFDPELGPGALGLWEDTLFGLQAERCGYRLGMAPEAVIDHHFDPQRLNRTAFLHRAIAEARSSAYVARHWRHEVRRGLALRMLEYRLRLWRKRHLRPQEWKRIEGIAQWEMDLTTGIEFARSYRQESRTPAKYGLYGNRKRHL